MTGKTIRCAIYTRKSSEEGLEQDFNSLHAQREACEAFIKSQKHEGWQMVKTHYDDGGFSGGNMERPALQQLMRDIAAGLVDVIVVYKVDRLSRSLHDFARMVEVFDKHKVSFVSVTQQFNTTSSMGRLTLNVLLSFAQFEREVTGERIRDKVAASKKKGMWMGGNIPLGYEVQDRKLVVNAAEAETVRHIYQRYLALGNVRLLRDELVREGIYGKKRPNGCHDQFSRGALYHLLSSRTYLGQIAFRGDCYAGQHDPILEPSLWEAVQEKLGERKTRRHQKRRDTGVALLQGKLFDAATGEELIPMQTTKQGRCYRYYISRSLATETKSHAVSSWRVPAQLMEDTCLTIARQMLTDYHLLLPALTELQLPAPQLESTIKQLRVHVGKETVAPFLARVTLSPEGLTVQLEVNNILPNHTISLSKHVHMRIRRQKNEMRLILSDAQSPPEADNVMAKSIAQAHLWAEELRTGKVKTYDDLAKRYGVSAMYVKRAMPLAYLAPAIVTAILNNQQPEALTKEDLVGKVKLPLCWIAQRQMFQI